MEDAWMDYMKKPPHPNNELVRKNWMFLYSLAWTLVQHWPLHITNTTGAFVIYGVGCTLRCLDLADIDQGRLFPNRDISI
jgi:hypothetical protein